MIHYVIKDEFDYEDKKTGKTYHHLAYYQKTSFVVLPMNHMTGNIDEAKKFDCRSEAKRVIQRVMGNRKTYTIVKVVTQ